MGTDADVVVVGAGPVGSALAILLGRLGLGTVLLEKGTFPRDKPCGEGLLPAGARVLEHLGLPIDRFPPLAGVSYRLPGGGVVAGPFAGGVLGRGTRRLILDRLLAESAAAAPNVELAVGCEATAVVAASPRVVVSTGRGELSAKFAVGADGQRSLVATAMGWKRSPRGKRYAVVGHLDAPGHGVDRILVTLLRGCEAYLAPTGPDQVLLALLGRKQGLRDDGEHVRDAYTRRTAEAHPELAGCQPSELRGAGPFWSRPSKVAAGRVFLVGDAAGFPDPLTGDGMSAGLVAAQRLASILATDHPRPAAAYRRWESAHWSRRVFMARLALALTASTPLRRLAVRGLKRRPGTLSRLLEVNDGSRGRLSLSARDWAALAGI